MVGCLTFLKVYDAVYQGNLEQLQTALSNISPDQLNEQTHRFLIETAVRHKYSAFEVYLRSFYAQSSYNLNQSFSRLGIHASSGSS